MQTETDRPKTIQDHPYALQTGNSGAGRLRLLDKVYGPSTRQMLTDADIGDGKRVLELGAKIGVDYNFGLSLPAAAADAGFARVDIRLTQPAYLTSEEKRMWEYTLAEISPAYIKSGVVTQGEVDQQLAEIAELAPDDRVLIAQACLPGVIARK